MARRTYDVGTVPCCQLPRWGAGLKQDHHVEQLFGTRLSRLQVRTALPPMSGTSHSIQLSGLPEALSGLCFTEWHTPRRREVASKRHEMARDKAQAAVDICEAGASQRPVIKSPIITGKTRRHCLTGGTPRYALNSAESTCLEANVKTAEPVELKSECALLLGGEPAALFPSGACGCVWLINMTGGPSNCRNGRGRRGSRWAPLNQLHQPWR